MKNPPKHLLSAIVLCSSSQTRFLRREWLQDQSSDQSLAELEQAFLDRLEEDERASLRLVNVRRRVRRKVQRTSSLAASVELGEGESLASEERANRTLVVHEFASDEATEASNVKEGEEVGMAPDNSTSLITIQNENGDSAAALSRSIGLPVYV